MKKEHAIKWATEFAERHHIGFGENPEFLFGEMYDPENIRTVRAVGVDAQGRRVMVFGYDYSSRPDKHHFGVAAGIEMAWSLWKRADEELRRKIWLPEVCANEVNQDDSRIGIVAVEIIPEDAKQMTSLLDADDVSRAASGLLTAIRAQQELYNLADIQDADVDVALEHTKIRRLQAWHDAGVELDAKRSVSVVVQSGAEAADEVLERIYELATEKLPELYGSHPVRLTHGHAWAADIHLLSDPGPTYAWTGWGHQRKDLPIMMLALAFWAGAMNIMTPATSLEEVIGAYDDWLDALIAMPDRDGYFGVTLSDDDLRRAHAVAMLDRLVGFLYQDTLGTVRDDAENVHRLTVGLSFFLQRIAPALA